MTNMSASCGRKHKTEDIPLIIPLVNRDITVSETPDFISKPVMNSEKRMKIFSVADFSMIPGNPKTKVNMKAAIKMKMSTDMRLSVKSRSAFPNLILPELPKRKHEAVISDAVSRSPSFEHERLFFRYMRILYKRQKLRNTIAAFGAYQKNGSFEH